MYPPCTPGNSKKRPDLTRGIKSKRNRALIEISRRYFLGLSLLTGLLGGCGKIFRPPPPKTTGPGTLEAYLDTLIPPDESPGGGELGVAEKILAKAAKNSRYRRLIEAGSDWLDGEARKHGAERFADLSAAQREGVVTLAAAGKAGIQPLVFFHETRDDAFFHYYAHPRSWSALGYAGPPQPRGFMDYADAPKPAG